MDSIAHPRRRTDTAQAQAINRLQPNPLASRLFRRCHQRFHPARLASLCPAQLHCGARVRFGGEIVVETHHPVNLGPAEVQRCGDLRLGFPVDAAECRLDIVQDRQQRPFTMPVTGDDRGQIA